MKRILIILAAFLMASCASTKQAVVIPSATPEMLIVRPTRVIPTAIVPEIAYTLTAANIPKAIQTVTPKPFEPVVIGQFTLEYLGNSVKTNSIGTRYVEISYRFTNNSAETASFDMSFSTKAFQEGVELSFYVADNSEGLTDIRPGRSIDVKDAFQLRSDYPVIELDFFPFLQTWVQPVTRTIVLK